MEFWQITATSVADPKRQQITQLGGLTEADALKAYRTEGALLARSGESWIVELSTLKLRHRDVFG